MSLSDSTTQTIPLQLDIFYATTPAAEAEHAQNRLKARGQCLTILKLFRCNPDITFTPFDVQACAEMQRTPITSIRRAMNTLTEAGLLIKTDTLRPGEYGALNHTWKLA